MLRESAKYHLVRFSAALFVLVLIVGSVRELYCRTKAATLIQALTIADTEDVFSVVEELAGFRRWANPLLARTVERSEAESKERLHSSLALLEVDPNQGEYLLGRLLHIDSDQFLVVRDALAGHKETLAETLWDELGNDERDEGERFRAACALAAYSPNASGGVAR